MQAYISEKSIEALEVQGGAKSAYILDVEIKGFKVTKSYAGTCSFSIQYKDLNGVQRQEKIGTYPDTSCLQARTTAAQKLAAIGDYKLAQAGRGTATVRSTLTVSEFFNTVYLPLKKTQVRAWSTQNSLFRNHIEPSLGEMNLSDVTQEHVVALHALLIAKPVGNKRWANSKGKTLAPATVNRILILLKHMFNIALERKVPGLMQNPITMVIQANRDFKARCLSREEITALLVAVDAQEDEQFSLVVRLLLFTGLRRSNVLAMEWSWVNFSEGSVTVPKENDKAKKGYKIFLSDVALDLLKDYRDSLGLKHSPTQGYVFPNPKTGLPYVCRRGIWTTCRDNAGLPDLRMHDLRHTYATMMLNSGSDVTDVQKALGHTQLVTTVRYLHINEQRKREKANAAVSWMLL